MDATLLDGAIVDLNVMTRRSSFAHSVQRLSGSYSMQAATGTSLILALDPLTVAVNNDTARLEKLDSVFIAESVPCTIEADHGEGIFFLITLQDI